MDEPCALEFAVSSSGAADCSVDDVVVLLVLMRAIVYKISLPSGDPVIRRDSAGYR